MGIPTIYHPLELVLGLMGIIAGFALLGSELFLFRKCSLRTWADNRQLLAISFWMVTNFSLYVSRAFDPPHQEAILTKELRWIAMAGDIVVAAFFLLARRLRKSQPEQAATEVAK